MNLIVLGIIWKNISLFLYQLRKNVIIIKQLHPNLNLLIVLDLCQLHYQIFFISSGIFNSVKCKSCIEKLKINSECCFAGLKNDRLIYKCKEWKEEWKTPLNKLIENFQNTYQFCEGNLNRFIMLLEVKGVYPYEYMDNWEFNETSLPPKKAFYSKLNLENITDKDYARAKKSMGNIWNKKFR